MGRRPFFSRFARLATRHTRPVLLAAVLLAATAAVLGAGVANRLSPFEASDPSTQSTRTVEAIERASRLEATPGLLALIHAPDGVHTPAVRAKLARIERILRSDPAVGRVASLLDGDPSVYVSRDGTMTYVAAQFHRASARSRQDTARRLAARLRDIPGVTLGGTDLSYAQGNQLVQEGLRRSELIAFPVLMVLLLLFFRGVIAALLPLALGGLSILLTELALGLANGLTSISVFTLNLVSLLGLGLAIDYSLLIVSRYREELAATPDDTAAALDRTMRTAGRTVCFSSMTVAASLATLLVFPQPYFISMGIGGALVVLLTCALALLVLPALLALLGHRVNMLAPAWLKARRERASRPASEGRWYRLAQTVMRHPIPVALVAAAIMLALASPFTKIELTITSPSTLPLSTSARQVDDALQRSFEVDPRRSVAILTSHASASQLARYQAQLRLLPDVASVAPPARISSALATIEVTPATPTLSLASQQLVSRIRALRTPFPAGTTGAAAALLDLKSSLTEHLPLAIFFVIAATTIALFLMTGSAILPAKTLVMNALTIGAAYGIMVLIFQDGNLQGLLSYEPPGAIDITQPVVMLAVVFGLSTDYGVFLLDRIREAHHAGLPNRQAVALGLERTGRVITTAAILFCVAVGSTAASPLVEVKEVSLGIVAAILLDATIVRSLLVPALMRLLGDRNWWAPQPLRKLHDQIGRSHEHPKAAQTCAPPIPPQV
jgi:uncharacterized membrane protein YdfJ with MMPL/SSD domain